VLNRFYDYGQAALLMASICRPERGEPVMNACGSALPDGPLLATGLRPVDASASTSQRLLVVDLGSAAPGAMPEVLAAYITSGAQGASPGLVGTPQRSSVFARFASTPSAAHAPGRR